MHILWVELVGEETGGTDIDSYNVKWDQGTGVWDDLIGEEGNYFLGSEHTQIASVTAGTVYRVTVRARNAHGWGPESAYLEIVAAEGPETPDPPVTAIQNHFVRI